MTLPKKSNQSSPPAIRFVVTRLLSVPDGWNVTTRRSVIAGLQVAARASHLVANREVAETRDLHRITLFQMLGDEFKEGLNDKFGMRTIKSCDMIDQCFCQACLIERVDLSGGQFKFFSHIH